MLKFPRASWILVQFECFIVFRLQFWSLGFPLETLILQFGVNKEEEGKGSLLKVPVNFLFFYFPFFC